MNICSNYRGKIGLVQLIFYKDRSMNDNNLIDWSVCFSKKIVNLQLCAYKGKVLRENAL